MVVAIVKARNSIGWAASYSAPNTVGVLVQVLPSLMQDPTEGS